MSDLISRLSLKDRASEYALSADEYERFCKIIDAETTAYDPDKVIKELEHTCDFKQLYKSKDAFGNFYVEKEIKMIRIDNAIEIVKAGVNNDK